MHPMQNTTTFSTLRSVVRGRARNQLVAGVTTGNAQATHFWTAVFLA